MHMTVKASTVGILIVSAIFMAIWIFSGDRYCLGASVGLLGGYVYGGIFND